MQHLVQFGAGNIGRSSIGALFAQAGWKVTFVDVDEAVVHELNRRGGYPVVAKHPDGRDERREVSGVAAISGRDGAAVTAAVRSADLLSTSVGLVETSIGKMVPLMSEADRRADLLRRASIHA